MLTQTLPTIGASHPTDPPSSLLHHLHPATYDKCPTTTPTPPSSPNPSSTFSALSTTPTGDIKIPHLPPELWLQIFPSILSSTTTRSKPFPQELTNLHLVCRGFHSLLLQHEASLVRNMLRTQTVNFPFPGGRPLESSSEPAQDREQDVGKDGSEGEATVERREERALHSLEDVRGLVFPFPTTSCLSTFGDLWLLRGRLESWMSLVRLGDVGGLGCSSVEGAGTGEEGTHDCGMQGDEDEEGISRRPPPAFFSSSSGRTFGSASLPSPAGGGSNNRSPFPCSPSSFTSTLESHTNRLTHLLSLPPISLALLLFKLRTALRVLRVLGPHPLRTTSTSPQRGPWDSPPQEVEVEEVWHDGNGMGLTSCEVEVVLEECVLLYGPEVLVGLMGKEEGEGDRERKAEGKWMDERWEMQRRGGQRRGRWAWRYGFFFFFFPPIFFFNFFLGFNLPFHLSFLFLPLSLSSFPSSLFPL
ncbi:hypothetical protein D0865_15959 [Hortaea werneckii]|uniref:Uncharacterized protein n=1 Tax=Hortaea werneckii TaxID=91943 RepID=A0A3M7AJM4_HORWE|nr:hypothetical protein D0865_15959 [Hortaea werneckii]